MSDQPAFELASAHKYFSATCYNQAWDLISKPNRTPEENEQMLRLSFASAWHWTQRPDCTHENLCVAYWQISRIYVLLGQAENARHYGQLALQISQSEGVPPWCIAYAHEALARAAMINNDAIAMHAHLQKAHQITAGINDLETKQMLLDDLSTIG